MKDKNPFPKNTKLNNMANRPKSPVLHNNNQSNSLLNKMDKKVMNYLSGNQNNMKDKNLFLKNTMNKMVNRPKGPALNNNNQSNNLLNKMDKFNPSIMTARSPDLNTMTRSPDLNTMMRSPNPSITKVRSLDLIIMRASNPTPRITNSLHKIKKVSNLGSPALNNSSLNNNSLNNNSLSNNSLNSS